MKKKIQFENLDGLRFLCFLSVFLFHSFHTEFDEIKFNPIYGFIKKDVFGNGNLGVNFFFVLSGFLITYLLLEEKKINEGVHIGKFWIRRGLRIWPLYFFCVFFGFILFPWLKDFFGEIPNETANPVYYFLFINNFDVIKNGFPDSSILGVLWSIAVEEQFYLLWPLIIGLLPTKYLWVPFLIIIGASLMFRAIFGDAIINEYHTLSCIGDMTVGASGAWLIYSRAKFKERIERLTKLEIAIVYLLFAGVFFLRDEILYSHHVIRIYERLLIATLILFIILEQNYSRNSFFKMSHFKLITKLGAISYGLYCLHFIGILVTTTLMNKLAFNTHLWQVMILETVIALLTTILISSASYRFYELPFLKLKDKFSFISRT